MPDWTAYFAFILAATAIIASPGPSVLFVITRSIQLGAKGGILSVAGVALGALCHALAVSLGLATLLQASPFAFTVIKHLGCLYLLYLGLKAFFDRAEDADEAAMEQPAHGIVLQGFLVEFLNPKTALFFLAFLPQFATAGHGSIGGQLLTFGLTFVAIGLVSDSIYALAAGRLSNLLKRSRHFRRTQKYFSGTVYCGLGIGGLFYKASKSV